MTDTGSDEKEEEQACQQHDFVSVVSSCTGIFLLCIMSSVLVPPDSLDDYYSCTSKSKLENLLLLKSLAEATSFFMMPRGGRECHWCCTGDTLRLHDFRIR